MTIGTHIPATTPAPLRCEAPRTGTRRHDGKQDPLSALVRHLARQAARQMFRDAYNLDGGPIDPPNLPNSRLSSSMIQRAAIYARYSSDSQREASIDDQIRLWRGVRRPPRLDVGGDLSTTRLISGATGSDKVALACIFVRH